MALVNFTCIEQYVNQIRTNQSQVYNAFIKYINTHGGIDGRQVVPDYQSYCPIQSAPALALCTQFTEDAHVFAVMGDFIDFSGDAQTCIAKDHHTVLLTFDLTQAIINQSPPGLIILPGETPERTDSVLISLMKSQHTLAGKKIAVLGELDSQNVVQKSVVPDLKRLGVPMGSTAILDVTGADTSAAQSQLASFIERWKSENVTALYVSGTQVASKQFIEAVRQAMPKVMLITDVDTTTIQGYGQQERAAGRNPNPYEGIISTGGPTSSEYDASSNWKHCAAIYKQETGKVAPERPEGDPRSEREDARHLREHQRRLPAPHPVPGDRRPGREEPERQELGPHRRPLRPHPRLRRRAVRLAPHRQVRRQRHLPPRGVRLQARTPGRVQGR